MSAPEVLAPDPASAGALSQFYRLVAGTIPHMVWTAGPDGAGDFFNARVFEYTGASAQELTGWGWTSLVHPEDLAECLARWKAALASGERYETEYRLRRADGEYRWHLGAALPLRDAGGRIVKWFGTCTDIENRKRAAHVLEDARAELEAKVEERTHALQRSIEQYRMLVASVDGIVWEADARTFAFCFVSEKAEKLLGYPVRRWIEEPDFWRNHIHPEDVNWAVEFCLRATAEKRDHEFEYRMIAADGRAVWLHDLVTVVVEGGQPVRLRGIMMDITERKRAEQALTESEARFRSLTELSADWYWEQDEHFRFVSISREVEPAAGSSVESHIGKRRWELPVVGVSDEQWAEHRATLEAHRPFRDFEYQRMNERGEIVWMSTSGDPIFDARGRFRGYRGIGRNITERKRAEIALRESERRFQSFMDNVPAVAWIKDSQLRYTWVNASHPLMRGGTLEQIRGRRDVELWPADVARQFRGGDEEVLRANGLIQFQETIPGPGGRDAHWLVAKFPLPDATGAPGVAGIRFDITERHELERALRQNEKSMNLAMEAAHLGHWSWDAATDRVTLSPGIYRIHGLSPDKPMPSPAQWRDTVHPEDRKGFVAALRETVKHGTALQHEYRILRPDGGTRWMLIRGRAEAGADGRTARTFGVVMDVTERVEAQRAQQRYAALSRELLGRLVQAQEDERHRIAGELHDLIGQKLTALGIGLQIVLDEMAPDSASRVAPRLSQMAALLEETIGAIREVMADLRPPVLDHHGLVSALHWYAPVFEARTGLRVRVAGPERGARLPRDVEISLFRIAQEALTNAAKHSGASLVQVRVDLSPARVELRVEDDGRGFRESRGARAARRGGWGLPAMRERAEAIGGRLSVETGGPGARIIVQVPLANADHGHPG